MSQLENYAFSPIAVVHAPFKEKFGIPRQSRLANVESVIEFLPVYAITDAVAGLQQFSHIWITFVFHGIANDSWRPLVRPPRLGGNEKIGVFATRSTHRPNPIGLSVVELLRIDSADNTLKLHIRGGDFLDGTPVLDIKPYIPYADAIPEARAGYAQQPPAKLPVRWRDEALLAATTMAVDLRDTIEAALCFDPRPAYHDAAQRVYGVHIANCNVRFCVDENVVEIIEVMRRA